MIFDEPFTVSSDYFEPIYGQTDVIRNFGFLDKNRNGVFGDILDGTLRIYYNENNMFDFTISRRHGDRTTVLARVKSCDEHELSINSAYIVRPNEITNVSITFPPNLDQKSNHVDIELEPRTFSKVKIGFNDILNRRSHIYFGSEQLVCVMPANCGHESHIEKAMDSHAKTSLPLVGPGIVTQFIHNYMEQALLDNLWNDPEVILPGLLTYIGTQKYLPSP